MKGIQIEKFGSESVLQLKSLDTPPVTETTVLVKIISAGVNPVDAYIRAGAFMCLPELPFVPGKDGAGIVQEIGINVKKVKVGQRVFVCGVDLGKHGTYAEMAAVPESAVFPLDDSLNFDEGASLGIPYFTAYRALFIKSKCLSFKSVLVHGASGSVGLAAVQMAKNAGAKVFASAGTEEGMAMVKQNGADVVVCHREKGYLDKVMEATGNEGVSCVFEMMANVNLDKDLDLLSQGGTVAVVGCSEPIKIDPRKMMTKESSVVGVALLHSTQDEWEETASYVVRGAKEGFLRPPIDRAFPLAEAAQAHKEVIHSKGAKGKIVLRVQEP